MLSLGGKVLGFSVRQQLVRVEGRERLRYHPHRQLLCRYHRHAPPERGRAARRLHALRRSPSSTPVTAATTTRRRRSRTCSPSSARRGRFNDLTVGFCGDLKFGRTVHSLISALSRYTGIKIVLISPEELKLPSYVKNEALKKHNIPYEQTTDLEAVMPRARYPVHDPCAARALLQRRGLPASERQLHPHPGKAAGRRSRICASCTRCPASTRSPSLSTTTPEPATSNRSINGKLHPHGADPQAAWY